MSSTDCNVSELWLSSLDDEEAVVHKGCWDMDKNYLSYFEVSKTFESILGYVFAVKYNRIGNKQHLPLIPVALFILLVSSWFSRTLTPWSINSAVINLLSRHPVQFPLGYVLIWFSSHSLPVYEASTQFSIYVQSSFCHYSQHLSFIPTSFSSSQFTTIFSTYIRSFHLNPSSKYCGYYLCRADGAVLLQIVGPLWHCVCVWRGSCNSTCGCCFTETLSVYRTVVTCFLKLCLCCKLRVQILLQGSVKSAP